MQSKKNIRTNRKSKSIKRNNSKRRKKLKGGAKPCGKGGFCIDDDKWDHNMCYLGFMDPAINKRDCDLNQVCCFRNQI